MEQLLDLYSRHPIVVLSGAGVVFLAIVISVVAGFFRRRRFVRTVIAHVSTPGTSGLPDGVTEDEVLRRSALIVRLARKTDAPIVTTLGVDRLWSDRLQAKERASDFHRVIEFGADRGLFSCFLVALRNKRRAKELRAYLAEHSDFLVLRKLSMSGRGESFSGRAARDFFAERLDEIRELAGDPEWPGRYFAVKILVHDDDERSHRAVTEAFDDPHALVRRTVAEEAVPRDSHAFYERLRALYLGDPVYEVRAAAIARIRSEFGELHTIDVSSLDAEQALHAVQLFDERSEDDQNAAIGLLSGKDVEQRLVAARFLVRARVLHGMLARADFGDRADMERTRDLLGNAMSVNVTGFLSVLSENPSPATLMIGAELLCQHGDPSLIRELAERVLRIQERVIPGFTDLYAATLRCISTRGDESTLSMLSREIPRRVTSPDLLEIALDAVPSGHDLVFRDALYAAMADPAFPARDALRRAILRLDPADTLSRCLDIVTSDRDRNPHRVRIDALTILGQLKLAYALQEILENLSILPAEEAREFAHDLAEYNDKELERKVKYLLDGVDGAIRAAIIAALPSTGKKTFLPQIKSALRDADPDVRIAATWALVDYEETRALGQAVDMLRDPVERVRTSVARALSAGGGPSVLKSLAATLEDPNEVDSVKLAVIDGLGAARSADAVDALVSVIERGDQLRDATIAALGAKRDKTSIARIIERFKDADPDVRSAIADAFTAMGTHAEPSIREVLEEGIESLKPFLVEILESTGYVDSRIRKLKHRDPSVRREAASFLSLVGSPAAFRGIVLAARDPDADVRVEVTKALEALASEDGTELLRDLEQDPDRRIRKYTHWALERVRAKSL
ncbi:MAG: HEAT repeat domain-containing protein [Spirochaetaceae bacterium]|nr:MAG: HEAT repeat domain-containing protein [Spirochaetaceae bacterium]